MVPKKLTLIAFAAILMAFFCSLDASASPFCVVVTGIPPDCIYVDAAECHTRALQLNGVCRANANEIHVSQGNAPYCLVNASGARVCAYADYQSCDNDAAREGQSACIDNTPEVGAQKDLFRTDPNFRY